MSVDTDTDLTNEPPNDGDGGFLYLLMPVRLP